jgi:SAM-dependent methyltransferase
MIQGIPIAMLRQVASNPKILGPLLISTVGAQRADEIIKALSNNQIPFDDVLNILVGSPISSVVNQMGNVDTPDGKVLAPTQEDLDRARKESEILSKPTSTPIPEEKKVTVDDIGFTQVDQTPQIISSPIPPEEKVSVDDVGFTPIPALRLEDMIMTAKNPEDLFKDERFLESLKMAKGDPDVDYREQDKNRGDYIIEAPQADTFWTTAGFPGDKMNPAKSVIIYIKPGDYLNLALKKESDYNEASFELYKNTNVGISVPKLLMNEDKYGVFSVTGHEGRHRAKYFESLDPDTPIPVQVQLTNKGSDEYVDYTKGYYTHGQSVLNAGKKLEELGFAINENGKSTRFKIFGYQGDGQKVGEIFQKDDITLTNEKTDTVRQGEGQTTIEALKTKSLQGENVDQGSSGSSRENVLKTEEGFEVANKALGIDFFTKVLTKEIAPPKKKYEPILDVSDIGNTFDVFQEKRTGDFENHIFTSIPTFQEAQVATADALIKTLPQNGSILDLGGTEGGFINTIAEQRPDVSGFIVDPNVVAQKMFNEQQMPNAYYIREAFTTDSSQFGKYAFDVEDENEIPIETNYFDFSIVDDNSLDAVTEKMTFQFIDKGRNNKIKLISEKLKPEGIALFEEKFFTSKDDPVWQANEAKKNEFKLNYYDQKDLTEKQKNILEGMDKHQVTSPEFEEILSKYFNNVVQYWDSGNFKGYVASDSADTINKFLNNLEDLNSEYSNVSTPRFVTDKIVEKRRGGSISLPQMNML